jgi:site-specific DNA-methyltransferase (adenine-specific)
VNFFHVKRQPLKTTEDVCVFFDKPGTYSPQMSRRDKPIRKSNNNVGESSGYRVDSQSTKYIGRVYDSAYPSAILDFSSRSKGSRGAHPTQKPVALMEYLIRTYTSESETVLDNTMGSGTTLIACLNTNRNGIGIEKDAEIFATAQRRVQAAQAERAEVLIA